MGARVVLALACAAALVAALEAEAQVYFQLNTGWSWAQNPQVKDTNTTHQTCVLTSASTVPNAPCDGTLTHMGSSFIIGAGVGYKLPLGFRVDVTYNNRSGYDLSGSDPAGTTFDPKTTANTVMLNGYYDLPFKLADGKVTPYVGGGIGRSRNKVNNINWSDSPTSSGQIPGGSDTSTAWQLTVGADIRLTQNWVLDLGYRYTDLGDLKTNGGTTTGDFNSANYTTPLQGKLKANEFVFNIRYEL